MPVRRCARRATNKASIMDAFRHRIGSDCRTDPAKARNQAAWAKDLWPQGLLAA
jgi:hypothetical protein